jgi:hypothetical protein
MQSDPQVAPLWICFKAGDEFNHRPVMGISGTEYDARFGRTGLESEGVAVRKKINARVDIPLPLR